MQWWALAPLIFLLSACATPVGVSRVDPRTVHRELTRNVLSEESPSGPTRNVLYEQNLKDLFDEEPEQALAKLHGMVAGGSGGPNEVFALSELSFLHAENTKQRPHYLAAAVYAYAFLFPDDPTQAPNPFDPRLRDAADLYNRGLTAALESQSASHIELRSGVYKLPFGEIEVAFDESNLSWAGRRLGDFVPVAELKLRGLETRYRRPGIGAPLAASALPIAGEAAADDLLAPDVKVPATAVLRIEDLRSHLASGELRATLELHVTARGSSGGVTLGNRVVPLEAEPTAVLAYRLAESPILEQELAHFFGTLTGQVRGARLSSGATYRPGRIPVVFVHGTASSIGRWAEMVNRLGNDPRITQRYQFWFFTYDSGSPIGYSAMQLREALRDAVRRLDPDGQDPELRRMVLIGHSQGGLLVKMTVINSGSKFYDAEFRKPLNDLEVSADTRELIRRVSFVEPLPFVERVVFISTPHHGSYLTLNRFAQWLTRFITLPVTLMTSMGELVLDKDALVRPDRVTLGTSVDNMNPYSTFIQTLAAIPLVPGVHAHSIIAVKGEGAIEDGDDGVVKYASAHIEGVESELVVRSDHSAQWNALAIEEVRRILLRQAGVER